MPSSCYVTSLIENCVKKCCSDLCNNATGRIVVEEEVDEVLNCHDQAVMITTEQSNGQEPEIDASSDASVITTGMVGGFVTGFLFMTTVACIRNYESLTLT